MRCLPLALIVCVACTPQVLLAQDESTAPEMETGVDDSMTAPPDDTGMIDAGTLHNNASNNDSSTDPATGNAGSLQSNDSSGWVHSHSESSSSSSSTTLTVGDPAVNDDNFAPPVRDDNYWEASLAGRWMLQGQDNSCTVTLTSTRWGNSGYRFNGPAGCPSSLMSGVSWAMQGGKLVIKAPVSPIATFRERSPNRWEGSDTDGNRLTLTR